VLLINAPEEKKKSALYRWWLKVVLAFLIMKRWSDCFREPFVRGVQALSAGREREKKKESEKEVFRGFRGKKRGRIWRWC